MQYESKAASGYGSRVIAVLNRRGFVLTRSSGSHQIYNDGSGRRVTVPFHAGKILHPKVLQSILRDMDMSVDAFRAELK